MFAQISRRDFSQQGLYDQLRHEAPDAGAIVTFSGLVRDFNHDGQISGIHLEHFPDMTEKVLGQVVEQAIARFELISAGVVHRIGDIPNHEQIVWVGCAARHRKAAFDAATFIMDILKKSVPLWKKEYQNGKGIWVEAKSSDDDAAMKWLISQTPPKAEK